MFYTESDIKWEGKKFAVIYCRSRKRHEVLCNGITHSEVYGWGTESACIRTAERLERYAHRF